MVSDACHTSRDHTPSASVVLSTTQTSGSPVQFVKTQAEGVPIFGVVSVGEVARTGAPLHCAVVHTGRADAPPHTRISVVAPFASVCCAQVAVVPVAISE